MAKYLIPADTTLKAIKAGDARKRINDGAGLYLQLFVKGGSHGWRFAYSLAGRRNILSLGTYPDVSLALARKKADDARRLVAEGQDPSAARQEVKAEAQRKRQAERLADAGLPAEGSFEAVARDWLKTVHEVKVSAGHAERTRIRLEQDAFPWIGRRPIV